MPGCDMPDVVPTFDLPPGFIRASAFTELEVAHLGVPRGLVPHAPTRGTAAPDRASQIDEMQARLEALRAEPAPGGTGLGPRARFRFQAHGSEREVDPPSNLTRDPATSRRAGAVRKTQKPPATLRWSLVAAVGAAAIVGGYWLGRPPGSEPAATAADERADSVSSDWTTADRDKLAVILAAENSNRPGEMRELTRDLLANRPQLKWSALLEARASVAARLHSEAEVFLERARAAGAGGAGEIAFLRASNFGAQRKLDEMRNCVDDAIAADPVRAEFHFARAEIDRRLGRVDESLASYARALERARVGRAPSVELMAFRRRLLLIEGGRESEIDASAYQNELARPAPSGDWLLTAAAVALQHHDLAEAARWLKRARAAMPSQEYLERIDDYFFRVHVGRPELNGLFPTSAERSQFLANARPVLVDP